MNTKTAYQPLSIKEFWLLLSQFAPAVVLGVENPYTGWLAEEISSANREAAESLLQRGLVRPINNEMVDVDDGLLTMAKACIHPQHSVILQVSHQEGKDQQRYIHLMEDLIVEHYQESPGQHRLGSIASRHALIEHLKNLIDLQPGTEANGNPFQLPEKALFEASGLGADGNEGEVLAVLNESDLTEPQRVALAATLCTPLANASVAVIINQGNPETQHVGGFGILQGKDHLWVMTPFEKMGMPMVRFDPVDNELIQKKLEETIPA